MPHYHPNTDQTPLGWVVTSTNFAAACEQPQDCHDVPVPAVHETPDQAKAYAENESGEFLQWGGNRNVPGGAWFAWAKDGTTPDDSTMWQVLPIFRFGG